MSVFVKVADVINVEAVRSGSVPSDLLPPRHEDKVSGQLEKRFAEHLRSLLDRGRYDPQRAVTVYVPKPGSTTRPASLLTLEDRVVYSALVEALRPRIESALLGPNIVFWPRGAHIEKRWREFEIAPIENSSFITRADISGFYESIDHEALREQLIWCTGKRDIVNALCEFLQRIMNSNKGLPQGLEPSDALATAYLNVIDAELVRKGFRYYRHGDDIRIATSDRNQARTALYVLEQELRKAGLMLNGPKSFTMSSHAYTAELRATEEFIEETKIDLLSARISALETQDTELVNLLKKTGNEELGWKLFYHGSMSFDEVVIELIDHIKPNEVEVAGRVFSKAIDQLDLENSQIRAEAIHHRLTSSLIRLTAGKSPAAVPYLARLLKFSPEKAGYVVSYISTLDAEHAAAAMVEIHKVLQGGTFLTPWEKYWYLRLFVLYRNSLPDWATQYASGIAGNEEECPICRAEAAQVLAKARKLPQLLFQRLWNVLSPCVRTDLLVAAYLVQDFEEWGNVFTDAIRNDPVYTVVLSHLKSKQAKT